LLEEIKQAVEVPSFQQETCEHVLRNLKCLIFHQQQLKAEWDALASPARVKSILGLLPEYACIDKMLSSPRHDNPALNCGLYEMDALTHSYLKEVVLLVRHEHFKEIRSWLEHAKDFLRAEHHSSLVKRCNSIEEKYHDELAAMGVDELKQARMVGSFVELQQRNLFSPLRIVGYAGRGISGVVHAIKGKAGAGKGVLLTQFKKQID